MSKLHIIPLGGVEEIGINCTAIRYGDQIIVIDAGLGFSDVDHLGIDHLIPNFDYLQENKHLIKGIIITHGHLDHIGAIEYLVKALGQATVYASPFAMELIKHRLQEGKAIQQARLELINDRSLIRFGELGIEFFRVTHSIPEAMGVIINTPVGKVVHTGDFKFDHSPLNEPGSDYLKIAQTGASGVRVLLADSTNSFRPGHSISETEIMGKLEEVIRAAEGRVVVATFASLITRLYALVEIAKKHKRKVYITGRSMQHSIETARKLRYIDATDDLFIDSHKLKQLPGNQVMVLATGSQGESAAALSRMARGEHRDVTLKKGDLVIMSSSIIPGNDALVQALVDDISKLGAKILNQDIMNLHTSGHGFIEDQKLMIHLVRPEIFVPVHGYQYFLRKHAESAVETGVVQEKNCAIPTRGDIIEIDERGWKIIGKVKNQPVLVSGSGVGDVGPVVLQDRARLAANGIVVVNVTVAREGNGHKLVKEPTVITRGFVYVRESQELIESIKADAGKLFHEFASQPWEIFSNRFRNDLERKLNNMLFHMTGREPMIIVNLELV